MSDFLDTNILLYAVGNNEADRHKREKARDLLLRSDVVLSLQVLNEFVWQSTRPHKEPRLTIAAALSYTAEWKSITLQDLTLFLFERAATLLQQHKFSWWDCLIIAAAHAQGCETLYSEDMQDGRIVDGLRIVNPFREL